MSPQRPIAATVGTPMILKYLPKAAKAANKPRKSGPHSLYIQTAACEMPKILLKLI
jgi:hypothetical protein